MRFEVCLWDQWRFETPARLCVEFWGPRSVVLVLVLTFGINFRPLEKKVG
jgi:hypothetical protein